ILNNELYPAFREQRYADGLTSAVSKIIGIITEHETSPGATAGSSSNGAAEGFVSLFNGKDLTGWKTPPNQPGNWRVEDGAITGSGPGMYSHLFSDRDDYENFHLRAVARINFFRSQEKIAFGNSGIYFRSDKTLYTFPTGYEAQIFAGELTPEG